MPFLTEIFVGVCAVACALFYWQHEIELRAIRNDVEVFKEEVRVALGIENGEAKDEG
jgi:hypothetical protein